MSNQTTSIKEANINLIQQIKKQLKDVKQAELCEILDYSRQNLHHHLSKFNIDKSSKSDTLLKIANAIAQLKAEKIKKIENSLTK